MPHLSVAGLLCSQSLHPRRAHVSWVGLPSSLGPGTVVVQPVVVALTCRLILACLGLACCSRRYPDNRGHWLDLRGRVASSPVVGTPVDWSQRHNKPTRKSQRILQFGKCFFRVVALRFGLQRITHSPGEAGPLLWPIRPGRICAAVEMW